LKGFDITPTLFLTRTINTLRYHIAINIIEKKRNYFKYFLTYLKIYILEFLSLLLADRIIFASDSDIQFILKTFKLKRIVNKISHFFNYIDVDLFKPMNLNKNDKHILFVGHLYLAKNLLNLLNALKNLESFVLDIVGEGKLKETLKKKIKELGINVNFLGRVPNEKLPKIINKYQIFILPSFYEGNPKVLLEAMSLLEAIT